MLFLSETSAIWYCQFFAHLPWQQRGIFEYHINTLMFIKCRLPQYYRMIPSQRYDSITILNLQGLYQSTTLLSGFVLDNYYGNQFLDKCQGFTMVFFKVNYEYHALTKSTVTMPQYTHDTPKNFQEHHSKCPETWYYNGTFL